MTILTSEQITALQSGATLGPWSVAGCRVKLANQSTHAICKYDGDTKKDVNIANVWFDVKSGLGRGDAFMTAAAPDLAETALAAMAEVERLKFGIAAVIYSYSHSAGVGGPALPMDEQPDHIQGLAMIPADTPAAKVTVQEAARVLLDTMTSDRKFFDEMVEQAELTHGAGASFNKVIGNALRAITGGNDAKI
jgi:hypothetical protein